jgi:hypothetical protein
LAPKCYYHSSKEKGDVIKYKGAAKEHVDAKWFETQYKHPENQLEREFVSNFRVNIQKLSVYKRKGKVTVALALNNKRMLLHIGGKWVGSTPKVVFDLESIDNASKDIFYSMKQKLSSRGGGLRKEAKKRDPTSAERRRRQKAVFRIYVGIGQCKEAH